MKKKLIFIGNSIVAGYPFSRGKSFVGVLRKDLKDKGYDIINKGVNGDTTAGIAARLQTDALSHNPDMVFVLTGTNDFIYRDATPEEAFANMEGIAASIEATDSASGGKVVPVFITPLHVDPDKAGFMWMAGFGIVYEAVNRDIDKLREMIINSGRRYVDMTALFDGYCAEIGDPDLVYLDGLHPLDGGHRFMAEKIAEFLEQNRDI